MSKTTELDQAELIEGADQLRKMGIEIHRVDQRWMVFLYPPLDSGVPVIGSGSLELFVDTLVVVRNAWLDEVESAKQEHVGALKPKTGWLSRGNGDSPSALMAAVGSVYDAAKYVPIGIVTPLSEVEAIKKRSADDGEFNSRQERLEVIIQLAKTARTSVEVFLSALAQAVDKGMVDGDLLNYHYSDGATQGIDVAVFAERVNDVLGLLASAPEQQVQRNVGRHTTNLKEAVVVWENVRELGELSVGDGKTHMSLLDALALNGALDGFSASYPELRMVRTGPERLHVLEAVQKFLESRGQSGPPSVVKTVYEAMAHEMFKEIAKHELAVPNDALSQVAAGMGIAANEDGAEGASAMDNLVLAQARCGYSVMGVIVPSRAGVNAILAGLAR